MTQNASSFESPRPRSGLTSEVHVNAFSKQRVMIKIIAGGNHNNATLASVTQSLCSSIERCAFPLKGDDSCDQTARK